MTDNTPTIDQFRPVVLRVLNDGQERPFRLICELAADYAGLSKETLAERVPSGQARYINRINWACSALSKAGLLDRVKRGHYRITADGLTVDKGNLKEYSEKDMFEWPVWVAYQKEVADRRQGAQSPVETGVDEVSDPIELMSTGERDFNAQTETDLRNRLQSSSPEFFEKAVIELL